MSFDKEALFKAAQAETVGATAEVEVPGGVVKLRALSRAEVLLCTKLAQQGPEHMERRMLALALVDPQLTEAEVEHWQKVARFGTIQAVVEKANELSGLGKYAKEAQKAAFQSLRGEQQS